MIFSEAYDPYNPYQYPWMGVNFFIAFWATSVVMYKLISTSPVSKHKFLDLPEDKRRNVVTYVFQLVATTVALALQLYGSRDILFRGQNVTTAERIDACVLAMTIIVILYLWELCYRISIGVPLMIHHVVTILLIQLGHVSFFDIKDVLYLRMGVLLSFYATTEQMSFVALLVYRLNWLSNYQALLFYVAAGQAFLLKTAVTLIAAIYIAVSIHRQQVQDDGRWGWFWTITFHGLLFLLYTTQVYASWILYTLAVKSSSKMKNQRHDESLHGTDVDHESSDDDDDDGHDDADDKQFHDEAIDVEDGGGTPTYV